MKGWNNYCFLDASLRLFLLIKKKNVHFLKEFTKDRAMSPIVWSIGVYEKPGIAFNNFPLLYIHIAVALLAVSLVIIDFEPVRAFFSILRRHAIPVINELARKCGGFLWSAFAISVKISL